jgi:hypothetical protein
MIYRGLGFLHLYFGPSPTPSPFSRQQLSLFSVFLCGRLSGEGGGVGRRARLYDSEKAWPSTNHSTLSAV